MRYAVRIDGASLPSGEVFSRNLDVYFRAGANPNVLFNVDDVVAAIGRPLYSHEEDWLDLLRAIHTADLVCRRGRNEDWTRSITLALPVRDPARVTMWLTLLQMVFHRMTHDHLKIHVQPDPNPPPVRFPQHPQPVIDSVTLLSGGLDSALAALKAMDEHEHPCFVSSRSSSHVIGAQRAVASALQDKFRRAVKTTGFNLKIEHKHSEYPLPDSDLSQRGRTLLFAGVAALIAAARGIENVTLGENGVMAINCPLTPGRGGGFSTHTAHPNVLSLMGKLFSMVTESPVKVVNPLLYMTKSEVVGDLIGSGLGNLIVKTHSCWMARQAKHCGLCIPCIVRRIATESVNAMDVNYTNDTFYNPAPPSDEKFLGIGDYLQFAAQFSALSDDDLLIEYPELIVEGGAAIRRPIIDAHRRWISDVLRVKKRYPKLAKY